MARLMPQADEEELARVARVVGVGAVKYADLCMNRESNYRFSYKKMLSMQGNTAPYMLYAFARVQGTCPAEAKEAFFCSCRHPCVGSGSEGLGQAPCLHRGYQDGALEAAQVLRGGTLRDDPRTLVIS